MSITILDIISPGLAEELELTNGIPEGEVVEFRLARAGQPDPHSTKQISTPAGHILAGRDMINDRHDPKIKQKMIFNIDGYEPIAKPGEKTIMNPIIKGLEFDSSGSIYCTQDDLNKWLYAKLHNKNGSNPNRMTKKNVVFIEVDDAKDFTLKNNIFDYRAIASSAILEADDEFEDLVIMASRIQQAFPHLYKFDISDAGKVKLLLSDIAEKAPIDFIRAVQEPKSYARLVVDNAIQRKKIYFDDHSENLTWNFKKAPGTKQKPTMITKLESAKGANKKLIEFLLTPDGNKHLIELKSAFEEHYPKPR